MTTANDSRNWESKTQKNQRGDPLNWKSEKIYRGFKNGWARRKVPIKPQKFNQKIFVLTAAVTRAELLKIIRKILRIRIL